MCCTKLKREKRMPPFNKIPPVLSIILGAALFILSLFIFSYVLIIGALVWLGIYLWLRFKAFTYRKNSPPRSASEDRPSGRTIDHQE